MIGKPFGSNDKICENENETKCGQYAEDEFRIAKHLLLFFFMLVIDTCD